jgi:hypothetical protein
MIGVTANAACSIALRNAILKGIPKAFWSEMYEAARLASVGDVKSLANKRADAIKAFAAYNVSEAQILARLGIAAVQDLSIDNLVTLAGFLTAIKEGESTPEQIFAEETKSASSEGIAAMNAKVRAAQKPAKKEEPKPDDRPPLEMNGNAPANKFTYAEARDAIEKAGKSKNADKMGVAEDMVNGVEQQFQAELFRLVSDYRASWMA